MVQATTIEPDDAPVRLCLDYVSLKWSFWISSCEDVQHLKV